MKQSESRKLTKIVISVAVVLMVVHIGMYLSLMFRIQDSEARLYTDLHRVEVDVLKLKN